MSKVLVICDSNWADEMDLNGFKVLEKEKWEEHKEKVKAWFDPKEKADIERVEKAQAEGHYAYRTYELASICVGTNEDVHYSSYEDWLSQFREKDISDQEATTLITLFDLSFTYKDQTTIREFGFFLDNPTDSYED